jgi:hypothetical protein
MPGYQPRHAGTRFANFERFAPRTGPLIAWSLRYIDICYISRALDADVSLHVCWVSASSCATRQRHVLQRAHIITEDI